MRRRLPAELRVTQKVLDANELRAAIQREFFNDSERAIVLHVADENDRLRADLAQARAALTAAQEILPRLKPCGHEGDEETGVHDEDCQRCAYDELEAALEAAIAQAAPAQGGEA